MADKVDDVVLEPSKITSEAELPPELSKQMDDILADSDTHEEVFDGDDGDDKGIKLKETEEPDEQADEEEQSDKDQETSQSGDEEEQTEDKSEPEGKEDEYEDVEPRLVAAGRRRGWSDEKIIKLAEDDPDVLESVADLYDTIDRSNFAKTQVTKPSQEQVQVQDEIAKLQFTALDDNVIKQLREKHGNEAVDAALEIIKPLSENLKTVGETVNKISGTMTQQQRNAHESVLQAKCEHINQTCDTVSKDYPVFGVFRNLPKDAYGNVDVNSKPFKARSELFDIALAFESRGMDFEKAVSNALDWYKGKYGENKIKQEVVRKLNDRKKKFTARPTKKHTKKQYASNEDLAEGTMSDIYNNVGIEL